MKKQHLTYNLRQTQKIAKTLAKDILKMKQGKNAVVIGLIGDLGSGKTTFIQGFATGLGIKEKILSPTFVIIKRYKIPARIATRSVAGGQNSKFKTLFHIDCYRIKNSKEILNLGFNEIISNPKNIVIIEWADMIKKIMPVSVNETEKKRQSLFALKNTTWIELEFMDIKTRKIVIK